MNRAFFVLVSLVVLVAGCGGGGGGSTTTASDWAAAYCSATSTWLTTLADVRKSVTPGDPTATASDAAQTMTAASNTYVEAIKGLGEPDTPNGTATQATATTLSQTLSGRIARSSFAIDTNNADVTEAARVKVVRQQVELSLADVTKATTQIAKDDPEVATAMNGETSCTDLEKALEAANA